LANRKYDQVLRQIDTADEKDIKETIVDLRKITLEFPGWLQSAKAQLMIANLYNIQKEYDKAIEEYTKVIENYPQAKEASARALFAMGSIYQMQNKDIKAEKYFSKAVKDYPDTLTSMEIPLYLARYSQVQGNTQKASNSYDEAVKNYVDIIKKDPNNTKAILAIDYLLSCYVDRKQWKEAITTLDDIIESKPETASALKAYLVKAKIYETQLEDVKEAKKVYMKVIEEFPDSPWAKSAKEYLNSLESK
jgi:tetratricopeptide (TPR) repeat protein